MQSRDKSQREVSVSTHKEVKTIAALNTFVVGQIRSIFPSPKLALLIDLTEECVFGEVDVIPRKIDK